MVTDEVIVVFHWNGLPETIPCKRYREFAVALGPDYRRYRIYYVPMGCQLSSFDFTSQADAIACMIEIDKLRNNWLGLTADEWEVLRPEIITVLSRFGTVRDTRKDIEKGVAVYPEDKNGYNA